MPHCYGMTWTLLASLSVALFVTTPQLPARKDVRKKMMLSSSNPFHQLKVFLLLVLKLLLCRDGRGRTSTSPRFVQRFTRAFSGMVATAAPATGALWLAWLLKPSPKQTSCLTFDLERGAVPCIGHHALVQHVQFRTRGHENALPSCSNPCPRGFTILSFFPGIAAGSDHWCAFIVLATRT